MFDPVATLYDDALALVERAAKRFRYGAAVQKNIVLGVLGHGLLELLDEHLLELWEVAQALDPQRTWDAEDLLDPGLPPPAHPFADHHRSPSTAGRFADYLLRRAANAEAIPKNLRSLQGLLGFASSGDSSQAPGAWSAQRAQAEEAINASAPPGNLSLRQLIDEIQRLHGWVVAPDRRSLARLRGVELSPRAYHFLKLTLEELAQNDHCHGVRGQPESAEYVRGEAFWSPRLYPLSAKTVHLEFRYPAVDHPELVARLADEGFQSLQGMLPARQDPRFPSHGSGLYLANLAAGAAAGS